MVNNEKTVKIIIQITCVIGIDCECLILNYMTYKIEMICMSLLLLRRRISKVRRRISKYVEESRST
jgi:hypothetical protein